MRKTRRNYAREAKIEPFELELEAPPEGHCGYITFKNPNRLETESAFDLARESDPEIVLRQLLSEDDFALWWDEWRTVPADETNALLEDIQAHYGAERGKPRR